MSESTSDSPFVINIEDFIVVNYRGKTHKGIVELFLDERDEVAKPRLNRNGLQKSTGFSVNGDEIVRVVSEEYEYDSTMPAWEIVFPLDTSEENEGV